MESGGVIGQAQMAPERGHLRCVVGPVKAARSERLVGVELRRLPVWDELLAPCLLDPRAVDHPQRLTQCLQALEVGQGPLGCPVQQHTAVQPDAHDAATHCPWLWHELVTGRDQGA